MWFECNSEPLKSLSVRILLNWTNKHSIRNRNLKKKLWNILYADDEDAVTINLKMTVALYSAIIIIFRFLTDFSFYSDCFPRDLHETAMCGYPTIQMETMRRQRHANDYCYRDKRDISVCFRNRIEWFEYKKEISYAEDTGRWSMFRFEFAR